MSRVFRKGSQEFEISLGPHVKPDRTYLRFNDRDSALSFLRGFGQDVYGSMALRSTLLGLPGGAGLNRWSDEQNLEQLAGRLVSGQARIAVLPPPAPLTWPHVESIPEEIEPAASPGAPSASERSSWVMFRVVDSETGDPIQGVELKIKLPSGEVKGYKTDGAGLIEIRDLSPGTCDIDEMTDDEALEVVQID